MATPKDIILEINEVHPIKPNGVERGAPPANCAINIQVANGWAVTGHYHEHTLKTVRLRKTRATESK